MATWPVTLEEPLITITSQQKPRVITTQMESGPIRRSMLTKHHTTIGTAAFVWNPAQMLIWEPYFKTTILVGTIAVDDFPLDLAGVVVGHRTFLTLPKQVTLVPMKLWRVTMAFETDERNTS